MDSKVKLFGHPIHPMLIAYPVAFYTSTLVAFIVYAATGDEFWLRLAVAANIAGVVMALVAAVPGFIDWLFGIPSDSPARRTGALHAVLNVAALGLFTWSLLAYVDNWTTEGTAAPSASLGITLAALGVGLTILAGFQGWRLVQTHHVGVHLSPEQQVIDRQIAAQPLRRTG